MASNETSPDNVLRPLPIFSMSCRDALVSATCFHKEIPRAGCRNDCLQILCQIRHIFIVLKLLLETSASYEKRKKFFFADLVMLKNDHFSTRDQFRGLWLIGTP